jgi:GT2 family glycosyltransferase
MIMANTENEVTFVAGMGNRDLAHSSRLSEDALIVCTKDRPNELKETIKSILESGLEPPTVIVVVDSSDSVETKQMLMHLDCRGDVVLVHIKSKPGLPHQRNVGAYFVLKRFPLQSKYLFFLDDDVTPGPKYFINARQLFETSPQIGVLGGQDASLLAIGGSRIRTLLGFSRDAPKNISVGGFGSPVRAQSILVEALWVPGGMQTIRGELMLLEAFNGRIRMYGEDVDMHLRLAKHTRIASSSSLSVLHRSADTGKDQPADLFAYEDAFRYRLGRQHRGLVNPFMVIFTTFVLAAFSGVLGFKLPARRSEFKGHVKFLIGLLRGSSVEQYVSHDEWYTEPPASN